jgi:hypothetical protein
LLPSPPGQAALPAPPLGPDVLAGRSLMDLLRYAGQQFTSPMDVPALRLPMTPEAGRQIVGPVPPPQVGGPQVGAPQLPAPGTAPPIALGNQSTGRPAIPLPDANVRPPLLQTPGVDLQRPPASQANLPQPPISQAGTPNITGAIDNALKPSAIEQAPVKSRARGGRRR